MTQLMQQQRAQYALKKVNDYARTYSSSADYQSRFKSYSRSLPAMIHTNGLGQAMAFCCAQMAQDKEADKRNSREAAYYALYHLLETWLCGEDQPYADNDNLLTGITTADMNKYRQAQAETQMLMSWVKKFAEAFLMSSDEGEGN